MSQRRDDLDDVRLAVHKYKIQPKCEFCGTKKNLKLENSRTAYSWSGEFDGPDDPNRSKLLCRACAKEHHDYWDDMWQDYCNSRF